LSPKEPGLPGIATKGSGRGNRGEDALGTRLSAMALVQYQQFTATAWAMRPGRRCVWRQMSRHLDCCCNAGIKVSHPSRKSKNTERMGHTQ